MQTTASTPIARDIVLVGGGHSHVGVLRHWAMHPVPGVRITLIGATVLTPYSGMLPGYVAGFYTHDEVHIDLQRLCAATGVRFIHDQVVGMDRSSQQILLANRPPVHYDWVSINTGSTPQMGEVPGAEGQVVPVKPIAQFNERWLRLLERVRGGQDTDVRVAVVGAGAAGVELVLALQQRLAVETRRLRTAPHVTFDLLSGSEHILPSHNDRVRSRMAALLAERGVRVHTRAAVQRIDGGVLHMAQGTAIGPVDEIWWVTQAGGAPWLAGTGLALDAQGFVRVNTCLQSVSDERVFAVGDVASWPESGDGKGLAKAGVYAVRMGMPLARNLARMARGEPLQPYRPQRRFLALLATGDGGAVASRGSWYAGGRALEPLLGRWKDHIDRSFMARFQVRGEGRLAAMPPPADRGMAATSPVAPKLNHDESRQAISALAMRCGGCGAKVGADVLSQALQGLEICPNPDVRVGLDAPDDAAIVAIPSGWLQVQTVDFFRAFIDDPFLFGRIAAQHALSDLYAMGAVPHTATAIATLPAGLEAQQVAELRLMMQGAVQVLNDAGCALVGGHTGEGSELALGFAVNGLLREQAGHALRKGGLRAGDALILTKPIGTGTVMAAHARAAADGRWVQAALASMQRSNRLAARVLQAHGAVACTDVTGFGLLGHLVEMLKASAMPGQASGLDANLDLKALPLLPGAAELAAQGVVSSLHAANVRLRRAIRNAADVVSHPLYPLLFDPQTSGGLLAGVAPERAAACVQALHEAGDVQAAVVGEVRPTEAAHVGEGPVRVLV